MSIAEAHGLESVGFLTVKHPGYPYVVPAFGCSVRLADHFNPDIIGNTNGPPSGAYGCTLVTAVTRGATHTQDIPVRGHHVGRNRTGDISSALDIA